DMPAGIPLLSRCYFRCFHRLWNRKYLRISNRIPLSARNAIFFGTAGKGRGWRASQCRGSMQASQGTRLELVRRAFRLEWLTAGWMLIEAAVAIGSGVAARSLSLIAFGADSLIELASAGVLLWRLDVEMRRGAEFPEE